MRKIFAMFITLLLVGCSAKEPVAKCTFVYPDKEINQHIAAFVEGAVCYLSPDGMLMVQSGSYPLNKPSFTLVDIVVSNKHGGCYGMRAFLFPNWEKEVIDVAGQLLRKAQQEKHRKRWQCEGGLERLSDNGWCTLVSGSSSAVSTETLSYMSHHIARLAHPNDWCRAAFKEGVGI